MLRSVACVHLGHTQSYNNQCCHLTYSKKPPTSEWLFGCVVDCKIFLVSAQLIQFSNYDNTTLTNHNLDNSMFHLKAKPYN
ncbi:hypothetical protein C1S45_12190 [Lactiplantibacillus plantarum]|uniref:Uncharacterized protein n=1 Tax=Lactiplantibacillus plantarum (strain ATCC BAA-793 / NCIMB 8826 / WCFS1) TaxID=220668 RepID=Q6LWH1_LACPL|nr:hypothetical protein [Lactiplantibacillus plantarum]CAG17837.1 hypothetical protein [Lactiplantibacillus plantarum WCFS1]MDE4418957.1 hypothetical protein [Lactiplantibacillus plantarum]MDE4422102.1 hypothetical protein [Lactiplantibacillus plantarum]MDE4425660.1 hypothetical protein [Lactiplantibacillus plantarum]